MTDRQEESHRPYNADLIVLLIVYRLIYFGVLSRCGGGANEFHVMQLFAFVLTPLVILPLLFLQCFAKRRKFTCSEFGLFSAIMIFVDLICLGANMSTVSYQTGR